VSFVWATVALLVLLTPGFVFFLGLYAKERISRDATAGGPLLQLAGAVLVALFVHGVLFCMLPLSPKFVPRVHLEYVFALLQLQGADKVSLAELGAALTSFRVWIMGYIGLTVLAGYALGKLAGDIVLAGHLRFLVKHQFVYDLLGVPGKDSAAFAYVLTTVQHEEKVLMYVGAISEYFFRPDGTIAYLVLEGASRFYLEMGPGLPTTTPAELRSRIGSSAPDSRDATLMKTARLVIEGEDIANVVFARIPFRQQSKDS
jgi:hypothetical protein